MQTPYSLLSVQSAFQNWRNSNNGAIKKTPSSLKLKALSLLKDHRISHITKALGISYTALKTWQEKHQPECEEHPALSSTPISSAPPASSEFIELLPVGSNEDSPNHSLNLSLNTTNGSRLTITGQLSAAQLNALVQAMSASNRQGETH